jgi:pre-mRNA-splicing factor SYF1
MLNKVQSDKDTVYEQDISREPGNIKSWIAYVEFKLKHGTVHEQAFVSNAFYNS